MPYPPRGRRPVSKRQRYPQAWLTDHPSAPLDQEINPAARAELEALGYAEPEEPEPVAASELPWVCDLVLFSGGAEVAVVVRPKLTIQLSHYFIKLVISQLITLWCSTEPGRGPPPLHIL